ncbi:CheR family methyltransferase [Rhodobacter sp. NSM]|uniref:CheR family methyltransferase n=1 Tax=Rhodobacter sp. NSM TaxID=3457501 RepID=UPI003FD1D10F
MPRFDRTDFARFCDYLYRRTGLSYDESKRYYIERRVLERAAATESPSFGAYLSILHSNDDELQRVVNLITVNETYFYRELHQLRCLSRSLLPEIAATRRPGDRIRIWSAPCSTGEEPYSLAIWLLENWAMVDAYNVEIVGSDIDTDALSDAVAGYFGERSLARLPPQLREAYFEPPVGRQRRIVQDLRESVIFAPVNLADPASIAPHGRFDIIFCRNLLIYFDEAAQRLTAALLEDALTPDGFLCLGHSESMTRISDRYRVRRFEDAVVYQRGPV